MVDTCSLWLIACDCFFMVSVAQLAERRIVDPVVVGSSPIAHPIYYS